MYWICYICSERYNETEPKNDKRWITSICPLCQCEAEMVGARITITPIHTIHHPDGCEQCRDYIDHMMHQQLERKR